MHFLHVKGCPRKEKVKVNLGRFSAVENRAEINSKSLRVRSAKFFIV